MTMKERHQEVKIEKERRVVIGTEKGTLKSLAEAGIEMERKARRGVERKTEIVSVITEVVVTGIIVGSVVKEENVVVGMMMITVEAVIVTMIGDCS